MTSAPTLGEIDPLSLAGTRVQLHHAALLVSAVGRSFGVRQPGFRHAALYVERPDGLLIGWPAATPGSGPVRAALSFDPPEVLLGDDRRRPTVASVALTGLAFPEVVERVRAGLAAVGLDPEQLTLRTPSDLPPGPLSDGEPFEPDSDAAAELGRWFAFADERLAEASSAHGVPLPIPCWPDHFDLAVVVRIDGPTAPPDAQVTLGFSPGDGTIPEPYLYITPWPITATRVAEVPAPAGGRWQVEGWVGLALTASAMVGDGTTAGPAGAADAFLERGFEIARDLVQAG